MRLLLLSFVFLSACAGLRNNDPQQLYGKTWRQLDKAESHLAELQFTPNGRVAGTDGCNRFTARVDVTERMQLNAIGSSKMFCEHGADQRFWGAINGHDGWRIRGNRLQLLAGKKVLMQFEGEELPQARYEDATEAEEANY
jgi:heat shock protein HslJ